MSAAPGFLLKNIRSASTIVNPQPCQPLTDDPDDSIFLECAGTAKADYLVTGNTKHFPKGRWKYTEIVTPRQFIDLWGENSQILNSKNNHAYPHGACISRRQDPPFFLSSLSYIGAHN
jgi:PIN domain-containing protein